MPTIVLTNDDAFRAGHVFSVVGDINRLDQAAAVIDREPVRRHDDVPVAAMCRLCSDWLAEMRALGYEEGYEDRAVAAQAGITKHPASNAIRVPRSAESGALYVSPEGFVAELSTLTLTVDDEHPLEFVEEKLREWFDIDPAGLRTAGQIIVDDPDKGIFAIRVRRAKN